MTFFVQSVFIWAYIKVVYWLLSVWSRKTEHIRMFTCKCVHRLHMSSHLCYSIWIFRDQRFLMTFWSLTEIELFEWYQNISVSLELGKFYYFLSFNARKRERIPITSIEWNCQSLLENWRSCLLRCGISWYHQLFGSKTDNDGCSR